MKPFPPNITAVTTNTTNTAASEAQKYSVENMYNICLILIARSAPGYSCDDIVETVNNNNQTRIDQEIENTRNLIAENAAKPPVQWWEDDEDEQEEDSNGSDNSDGSDDDR
jgi:hypothetical protein